MANQDQDAVTIPDGWTRVRRIGRGGQAVAFHIRHKDGREGAYRRIERPMSEVDRGRFQRELEILSQIVDHPGIVSLSDWCSEGDHPWYISELGESFQRWWRQRREQLKDDPDALVKEAIKIIRQVASALAICHDSGIVHRDLKPQNLIMKRGVPDPWPVLIDFGVAHDETSYRLTPSDDAVGNAGFSPDIMRHRTDDVPPWLDVFGLGQILIWMLDAESPKGHWSRPLAWDHAVYDAAISEPTSLSLRAFTAACSNRTSGPNDGQEALDLLDSLFPEHPPAQANRIDVSGIVEAQRRGIAKQLLINAALDQEVQAAAPLAETIYGQLRESVLDVLAEVALYEDTEVLFDQPFHHQLIGATDLLQVRVGPSARNIQLRIKVKIVPQNQTPESNEGNRAFWREHIPDDAVCFTFALEGGVPQAGDARYTDCRWVTIGRNGSMYLHPLGGDLVTAYGNNDLGGSAKGPGKICSTENIREYLASVFTNSFFWEFIAAGG